MSVLIAQIIVNKRLISALISQLSFISAMNLHLKRFRGGHLGVPACPSAPAQKRGGR